MMAEAGINELRIMDVDRWKTLSVLDRYLKHGQYKKVAEVSKKVWCEQSEDLPASSTALENGLKDVKELLCWVLQKPWSVGFTESRLVNACWLQSEAGVARPTRVRIGYATRGVEDTLRFAVRLVSPESVSSPDQNSWDEVSAILRKGSRERIGDIGGRQEQPGRLLVEYVRSAQNRNGQTPR